MQIFSEPVLRLEQTIFRQLHDQPGMALKEWKLSPFEFKEIEQNPDK